MCGRSGTAGEAGGALCGETLWFSRGSERRVPFCSQASGVRDLPKATDLGSVPCPRTHLPAAPRWWPMALWTPLEVVVRDSQPLSGEGLCCCVCAQRLKACDVLVTH